MIKNDGSGSFSFLIFQSACRVGRIDVFDCFHGLDLFQVDVVGDGDVVGLAFEGFVFFLYGFGGLFLGFGLLDGWFVEEFCRN